MSCKGTFFKVKFRASRLQKDVKNELNFVSSSELNRLKSCMCTVTLFPLKNSGFVLTSNRDEAPNRKALKPDIYSNEETLLWYPKDPDGNGSWIGVSSKNRAVCLLNGAHEKHKRQLPYRQSRGMVVTHLLKCELIQYELMEYNLNNIEPFTLVVADWNHSMQWFELVWDGKKRHVRELPLGTYVWSSATLYDEHMRKERKQWFQEFVDSEELTPETISQFHRTAGKTNVDYGVIMDRGFVKTTSITQIVKEDIAVRLHFEDLQTQSQYSDTLELPLV